jgi:hypothetical protein
MPFHHVSKKIKYRKKNTVYVLDGIATSNGEVGISGSRSSPCQMSSIIGTAERAQRQQPVNFDIVVNNANFNFMRVAMRNPPYLVYALAASTFEFSWPIMSHNQTPLTSPKRRQQSSTNENSPASTPLAVMWTSLLLAAAKI